MTVEARVRNHYFSKTEARVAKRGEIIGNVGIIDKDTLVKVRTMPGGTQQLILGKENINQVRDIITQKNFLTGKRVEFFWKKDNPSQQATP